MNFPSCRLLAFVIEQSTDAQSQVTERCNTISEQGNLFLIATHPKLAHGNSAEGS
jgi:hypothetical protein